MGFKIVDAEIVHVPFSGCKEGENGALFFVNIHCIHNAYSSIDADVWCSHIRLTALP